MKVGVFHVGTQHSWQTSLAFQEDQRLAWYATSIFRKPDRFPYRLEQMLPDRWAAKVGKEFRKRYTPLLQQENVWLLGTWQEWLRTLAIRKKFQRLDEWSNQQNIAAGARRVIERLAKHPVDVLWSYNTMSYAVFKFCRQRGIKTVLDQTIGHPATMNRVMASEMARNSECFLSPWRPLSADQIARQKMELDYADIVVVGSDGCADTLVENGFPHQKIEVIPYGFDALAFEGIRPRRVPRPDEPLRFLFVGAVDPRKGPQYLIEAFRRISPNVATLTLVGRLNLAPSFVRRASSNVRFFPQIPRNEVAVFFREADCFIFPSLFEGSAIVLYEALGAGLGIVQTQAAGTGVKHGENGLLIEAQSSDAIVAAVEKIVANRHLIHDWSRRSLQLASEYRWETYRERCRELVDRLVGDSSRITRSAML